MHGIAKLLCTRKSVFCGLHVVRQWAIVQFCHGQEYMHPIHLVPMFPACIQRTDRSLRRLKISDKQCSTALTRYYAAIGHSESRTFLDAFSFLGNWGQAKRFLSHCLLGQAFSFIIDSGRPRNAVFGLDWHGVFHVLSIVWKGPTKGPPRDNENEGWN